MFSGSGGLDYKGVWMARRGTGVFVIVKGRQETEITRWIGKRQLENEEEEKKQLCYSTAPRQGNALKRLLA